LILSDRDIRGLIEKGDLIIEPIKEDTIRENGVDLRFSGKIGVFKSTETFIPKESDPDEFIDIMEVEDYVLRPGESIIFSTIEYVKMPNYLMGFINLRSSFARLGLILSPTIIDAGFDGVLTVGLSSIKLPVLLRRNERILHVIFARLLSPSESPYRGRYKGRRDISKPFLLDKSGNRPI